MKAAKGNKEYTIDETQQKFYQDGGFDILDDAGAVVAFGRGKTISYEEHMKVVSRIEHLQSLVAELRAENVTVKIASEKADTDTSGAASVELGEKKAGRKETDKKAGE